MIPFLLLVSLLAGFSSTLAVPTHLNRHVSNVERRGSIGAGAVGLGQIIYELTNQDRNAYDTDIPNFCVLSLSTYAGGDCRVRISCDGEYGAGIGEDVELRPGPGVGTDTWNACYLNGRQYFYHEKVGDFSITYTHAGGVNDDWDGLHNPILQFAQIDNWAPIDAQVDADIDEDSGHICKQSEVLGTQTIVYNCGVPEVGFGDFGISNQPPVENTYAAGTCGLHFIQYQIPDGGNHYSLAMRVLDHDGKLIGQVGDSYLVGGDQVDATNPINVASALPWLVVTTVVQPGSLPDTDDAPIQFAYADQSWDSYSGQCSTGVYDSGSRQGDCTFTC